eukprot:Filipodium_phascolosomae@DN2424_c0_g1_i2.p1
MALLWHPDKAKDGIDTTEKFQLIQEAYETLSDKHLRAWYDDHTEQILRGEDLSEYSASELNLSKYFSSYCYHGFDDDEKGFYAVYSLLFDQIFAEESHFSEVLETVPQFGSSNTPWEECGKFYRHWNSFCSVKSFSWADQINTTEAGNRKTRRYFEQINNKARASARKEFQEEVRTLVKLVNRRDPRVFKHKAEVAKQQVQEQKMKEDEKLRLASLASKKREERLMAEIERLELLEEEKKDADSQQHFVGDDESSKPEDVQNIFVCAVCRKNFKSEKQSVFSRMLAAITGQV